MNRKQRYAVFSLFVLMTGTALFVRETAVQSAAQATAASTPVIESNVPVPMRDGVQLGADIYRPAATGRFPVLLCRTPYNKNSQAALAKFLVEQGYAVVVVDSRGLNASKGVGAPLRK